MTLEYFIALLILACIGAYFVWRNNFKTRQANAAATFRAAFDLTLSDLRNSESNSVNATYDILMASFPAHESAVLEFSRFLGFNRKAFLEAWHKYAYHEDMKKHPFPFLEKYSGGDVVERKRLRNLAITNINHLLSYANA
ncbi:hypothetical protein [Methylomonas rapida]|uniref:Uncharacterized protein n=1 Tax=Methylomonas rapida TaxID=2963939 RepID=A0ABY7GHB3_9GAMM|nr:hypothetical protein [Methylomonas rapida]WAR44209.1 hypothetical protein NM686_017800 [Methylomonas rapida]